MNRERRMLLSAMGAVGALSAQQARSANAKPRSKRGVIFNEVDARALGVVSDDANAAASNSAVINEFFATASSGSRLVLPRGRIHILETIELVNRLNVSNSLGLRGLGIGATELVKATDGDLVRVVGFFNYLGDMSLNGVGQTALHGVQVRGFGQVGADLPSKLNTFRDLRIVGCRVGIRVGHFSDLDGDPGDGANPDIAGNLWQNIFLDGNRYGIVRDGQNILNDHHENIFSVECDRNHVLIPFGGDFRCFTAQFGQTRESGPFPKIHANASSPILLTNVRSENGNPPRPQPIFLKQENTTTSVDFNEVVVTNQLANPLEAIMNPQIQIFGGTATIQSSTIAGEVRTIGGRWTQIGSDVGSLFHSQSKATLMTSSVVGDVTLVESGFVRINTPVGRLLDIAVGTGNQIAQLP